MPPPSTISRRTPRSWRSSASRAHLQAPTPVDDGRHGGQPAAHRRRRGARAVDDLLAVAGGEEPAAQRPAGRTAVTVTLTGDPAGPRARRCARSRGLRTRRRGSSARTVPAPDEDRVAAGPHLVHAIEVGLVRQHQALGRRAPEVAVERDAAAEHRCRAAQTRHRPPAASPGAAPARPHRPPPGPSRRPPGRVPGSTRSTARPGRLATSTMTPKATDMATPWPAPSPAAANAQAATPSRGPQPATLRGSAGADQDEHDQRQQRGHRGGDAPRRGRPDEARGVSARPPRPATRPATPHRDRLPTTTRPPRQRRPTAEDGDQHDEHSRAASRARVRAAPGARRRPRRPAPPGPAPVPTPRRAGHARWRPPSDRGPPPGARHRAPRPAARVLRSWAR